MKMSVSVVKNPNKTNIKHNNRKFTDQEWQHSRSTKHIDRQLSSDNIYFIAKDIKEIYKDIFDDAVQEYNKKFEKSIYIDKEGNQKVKKARTNRMIKDYYKHIGHSGTLKRQYELIISIGDKKSWDALSYEFKKEVAEKVFTDYLRFFQDKYNHFIVYNAVVHLDEAGAPHMHLNFVPWADGYKNGVSIQPSFSKALEQEGYAKGKKGYLAFREDQVEKTAQLIHEFGIERKLVGSNQIKDMHEYKEMIAEVNHEEKLIKDSLEIMMKNGMSDIQAQHDMKRKELESELEYLRNKLNFEQKKWTIKYSELERSLIEIENQYKEKKLSLETLEQFYHQKHEEAEKLIQNIKNLKEKQDYIYKELNNMSLTDRLKSFQVRHEVDRIFEKAQEITNRRMSEYDNNLKEVEKSKAQQQKQIQELSKQNHSLQKKINNLEFEKKLNEAQINGLTEENQHLKKELKLWKEGFKQFVKEVKKHLPGLMDFVIFGLGKVKDLFHFEKQYQQQQNKSRPKKCDDWER